MSFEQTKELIVLLLPPISALAGVGLAAYLNTRRESKSIISKEVMLKKLDCYEELYELMQNAEETASALFNEAKLAKSKNELESITDKVFPSGLAIAKYTDENKLYLDEDIAIHVTASMLGPSGVFDLSPGSKEYREDVEQLQASFRQQYNTGVELIKDYMGLVRLEKSFRKINKSKAKSHIVDYANELRSKYKHKSSS